MLSLIRCWLRQLRERHAGAKPLCEPPETLPLREIFDMPPFHPGAAEEKPCG